MMTDMPDLWGFLRLAAVLVLSGLVGGGLLVWAMAMRLLRPTRMREGRAMYLLQRLSPADLNLPYRDMNFPVRDQATGRDIRINGWWIEHETPTDRTAILVHGYSDAKVGGIAWAPLMRSLGFNVLAIDLRAHGESQGRFTTAGFYERHDLSSVIDELKRQQPEQSRRVVLFGVSLGAAVVLATAALRDDVAALIIECPYVDFPSAVLSHGENLPMPGRFFQRLALRLCEKIARVDYSQVRPVDLIRTVRSPLWIVQVTDDPFVPPADRAAIAAAVAARSPLLPPARLWEVEGSFHVLALADHPDEYRRRLAEFLDAALLEAIPS